MNKYKLLPYRCIIVFQQYLMNSGEMLILILFWRSLELSRVGSASCEILTNGMVSWLRPVHSRLSGKDIAFVPLFLLLHKGVLILKKVYMVSTIKVV